MQLSLADIGVNKLGTQRKIDSRGGAAAKIQGQNGPEMRKRVRYCWRTHFDAPRRCFFTGFPQAVLSLKRPNKGDNPWLFGVRQQYPTHCCDIFGLPPPLPAGVISPRLSRLITPAGRGGAQLRLWKYEDDGHE